MKTYREKYELRSTYKYLFNEIIHVWSGPNKEELTHELDMI